MALRNLSLKGNAVYDAGANEGALPLFFSRKVGPGGRVVAFEPIPDSLAISRRNLSLNRVTNVTVVPFDLGQTTEVRSCVAMAGSGGRVSMADADHPDVRYARGGSMRVAPLSALVRQMRLPVPDFVKMDIEGAELEALQGARPLLAECHPTLFIELHGVGPKDKAQRGEAVCALLHDLGYALFHVETSARVTPDRFVPGRGHLLCLAPTDNGERMTV